MRRLLLLTTCLGLGTVASAADFDTVAPIRSAIVYQQGAEVRRTATLDLPAGDHVIRLPALSQGRGAPDVALTGGRLLSVTRVEGGAVDGRDFFTAAQNAAYEGVVAAEEALAAAQDERTRIAAEVTAAEARLTYLRTITGAALTTLDPGAIAATGDRVAEEIAAAEVTRAEGAAAVRAATERVDMAGTALEQARRDLDATGARLGPIALLELAVTMEAPGEVDLTLTQFAPRAGWTPVYDATLEEAEGRIVLDRKLRLFAGVGLPLEDVALRVSTANPFEATAPTEVEPDLVAVEEQPGFASRLSEPRVSVDRMADSAVALESSVVPTADTSGPVVAYDYPTPVDLPVDGAPVTLSLDSLTFDARVFNRAVPRHDTTAFLVADLVNTAEEPLLPGEMTVFRDAARIGEARLPLVPAGDETEIAFGPQEHLRLDFVVQENATGDRGLIWTSGTRRQDLSLRVTNLSDTAEVVETLFALPFAEEEDIDVDVRTDPAPDARDVDDKRGVALWSLDVGAGETETVAIRVDLEWPDGDAIDYRP